MDGNRLASPPPSLSKHTRYFLTVAGRLGTMDAISRSPLAVSRTHNYSGPVSVALLVCADKVLEPGIFGDVKLDRRALTTHAPWSSLFA